MSDFLHFITAFFVILIAYYKWRFLHWRRAKVPFLKPLVPFGNCYRPITGKVNWALTMQHFYNKMKKNSWKHGGVYVFTSPNYLPVDLEYLKNILSSDFHYFTDRAGYHNLRDPLGANLFSTGGTHWRNLRPKLSPAFTCSKIKSIFKNLEDRQHELLMKLEEERLKGPIDVKEIFFCFALDIIGSWAFGIHLNSFGEETTFKLRAKQTIKFSVLRRLLMTLAFNFPCLASKMNLHIVPEEVEDFFVTTVRDVVNSRQKTEESRNDFLQLLLEMNQFLTIEDITAQCFIFVLAGFETSATLMTFALYELARNPEIQGRLREEIRSVLKKYHGKVHYDSLQEMKYLSQVVDESLRIYPPLPLITRKCVKDYKIPDENVVIKRGTVVTIPILGIHHDEEYYPNPEKFDPERFSDEGKNGRHKFAFIPFGGGPRTCIGMQMGLMQAKMGLACLVKNYEFSVNERTSTPLKMEPNNVTLAAVGGIWLDAKRTD